VGRSRAQFPTGLRRPALFSSAGRHQIRTVLPQREFAQSVVRVPFRILTADEEKLLSKNFGDIKKQIDNAFKKKK
jgi:hypothetical protein